MEQLISKIPVPEVWQPVIGIAGIIVFIAIAAWIVRYVLFVALEKITAKTQTSLDDAIAGAIRKPIILLAYVFGAGLLFNYLQSLYVDTMGLRFFEILDSVLFGIGVVVVAVLIVRIIGVLLHWYAETIASRTETTVDDEFLPLLDRSVKIVMYTIAALAILDKFNVDVKGLIAVMGVGSLAIAFAAKDTLANIIGGFVIMIDRPFRVGDRVEFEDGTRVTVYQIGIRSTKFLTFDNTLIIQPNAELMNSTIHNTSYPRPEVRVRVEVGVGYDSDIDHVKRVMMEEIDKHPKVLETPAPQFAFTNFGDSSLDVSVRCRVGDVADQFYTASDLREQFLKRFREEGIEIPFPQRVVTHINPDESQSS